MHNSPNYLQSSVALTGPSSKVPNTNALIMAKHSHCPGKEFQKNLVGAL